MTELWALTANAADVPSERRAQLAREMKRWIEAGHDGVVLETCHRVELYGLGTAPALRGALAHFDAAAARHVMRVAAGLESAIVGEDEVLHQVRAALHSARDGRRLDFRLLRLFETAIGAGRRARSRRTTSSGNLAQKAVAWLALRSELSGRPVVVAGAGRMGAALAHALAGQRAAVTVASRDRGRASRLAAVYAGEGVSLEAAAALSGQAAAIAVALAGPWAELAAQAGHDLPPIADISAPQAVPNSVRERLNGSFLGIDDLYHRDRPVPGAYIKDAEGLVDRHCADYVDWLRRAG